MRVLVAGATGVLGQPTVRALVAGGHDVIGLVRSKAKAKVIEGLGAHAVIGDVRTAASLTSAADGAEAIVHLASSESAFESVRVDGCRNLVAVARGAGVRRFVVGSGYWIFGHHEGIITEDSSIDAAGIGRTNLAAERVALAANEVGAFDVVVARPGMVYGPGGWFLRAVRELHRGTYRYVGDGTNHWSPAHPFDVGEAFRTLVERGQAGGVYLVVDDEPATVRSFFEQAANLLGAPTPRGIALVEAETAMGREAPRALAANQEASNAKLKGLSWRPRFPTFRDGLADALRLVADA